MARKQTRRSVSLSAATYQRLRAYCETNGLAMSELVELRLGDFLGRSAGKRPVAPRPDAAALQAAARIFTF